MAIHPAALIDPTAELGAGVEVGAYSVIGAGARIGEGTIIGNRVTIMDRVEIGRRNRVWDGAVLGGPPQDFSYRGESTSLLIGDENVIRECVTINAGTIKGGGATIIGSRNYFMACSHVGHDCCLEDNITMTNGVMLGGHVKVERGVLISGAAGVHHFVRIGRLAFVGALTGCTQDVPPFMMVDGHRAFPRRVNVVGLKRDGFSPERVEAVEEAFRELYRSRQSRHAVLEQMSRRSDLTADVQYLLGFLRDMSQHAKGRYLETLRPGAEPPA